MPLSVSYTQKTVSSNQRNIFLIYSQRKHFFELKKVLLIQKNFLWSKEIDLFTLKNIFLNQQNFLQFKEIFPLTVCQKNVSLIQSKSSLIKSKWIIRTWNFVLIWSWLESNGFTLRKQFLWIRETFLWYTIKEKISLNWRKFCWFKTIFFNVNKSISLDQRKFY